MKNKQNKRAHKNRKSSKAPQQGFTLIEVLIALVIFSMGLLAAAGLQLASLRATQFNNQLVVATSFTREYGEIIQSVPDAANSTHDTEKYKNFSVDSKTANASADDAKACTGASANCTTDELIKAMRTDWVLRVASALPGGRAVVCRDDTDADDDGNYNWDDCNGNGELLRVKMGWVGKSMSAGSQNTNQDWVTADRPRMIVTIMGNLKDYSGTVKK